MKDSTLAAARALRDARTKVAASPTLLWDQVSLASVVVAGGTPAAIVRASDFVVPTGATWTIRQVVLTGFAPTTNPSASVTVAVLADNAGSPGAVLWQATLTPVSTAPHLNLFGLEYGDNTFVLPTPLVLSSGRYWLKSDCSVETFLCALHPVIGLPSYETNSGSSSWTLDDDWDTAFALSGTSETPESATTDLGTTVDGLGLPAGTTTSLRTKLARALDAMSRGDVAAACNALADFISEVKAISGKKLTVAQAQALIAEANRIRGLLGC